MIALSVFFSVEMLRCYNTFTTGKNVLFILVEYISCIKKNIMTVKCLLSFFPCQEFRL